MPASPWLKAHKLDAPVMNIERMLELADFIETTHHFDPDGDEDPEVYETIVDGPMFNMNNVYEDYGCGTVACIAGWALLKYRPGHDFSNRFDWDARAAEILGLTPKEADHLFFGKFAEIDEDNRIRSINQITPAQAAAEMRRMVLERQRLIGKTVGQPTD